MEAIAVRRCSAPSKKPSQVSGALGFFKALESRPSALGDGFKVASGDGTSRGVAALDNTMANCYGSLPSRARMLRFQSENAPIRSYCLCERAPLKGNQSLNFNPATRKSYWGGVMRCSGSYCVGCWSKVRKGHIETTVNALRWASGVGNTVLFATFTMPTGDLQEMVTALNLGWKSVNDLVRTRALRAGLRVGTSIGLDQTFKLERALKKSTHLHIHAIFVFDGKLAGVHVRDLIRSMKDTFIKRISSVAGVVPSREAQKILSVKKGDDALARYISKDVDASKLALETLDSRFKISSSGISFHQLFMRAYDGGERALSLYRYFLSTMKGRKALRVSKVLLELAELHEEELEEEVTEEVLETTSVEMSTEFFRALHLLKAQVQAFELFEQTMLRTGGELAAACSYPEFLLFFRLCEESMRNERFMNANDWVEAIVDTEIFVV